MISIVVAAALVAAPALPPARVQIGCPFMPIFFEDGRDTLSEESRALASQAFGWVLRGSRDDVRIVLRTYARDSDESRIVALSSARADAARAAFMEQGVPADHMLVSHEYRSGPDLEPAGWRGGWVYPEFYVSPAVYQRIMPGDGLVC